MMVAQSFPLHGKAYEEKNPELDWREPARDNGDSSRTTRSARTCSNMQLVSPPWVGSCALQQKQQKLMSIESTAHLIPKCEEKLCMKLPKEFEVKVVRLLRWSLRGPLSTSGGEAARRLAADSAVVRRTHCVMQHGAHSGNVTRSSAPVWPLCAGR